MPIKKPIEWGGINYPTIKDASIALGLSERAMSQRVQRGYGGGRNKPCCWNGVKYKSLSEAAETLGIPKSTLWRKLKGNSDGKS